MLVDLREGTVEEDDGGVVEPLERVVARVLEVVLQPGEGVRHFRRTAAATELRDYGFANPRARWEGQEMHTGVWRRRELSCVLF